MKPLDQIKGFLIKERNKILDSIWWPFFSDFERLDEVDSLIDLIDELQQNRRCGAEDIEAHKPEISTGATCG